MDTLSPHHLAMLHASAISDLVIQARGYRTIHSAEELRRLGFAASQCRLPGLLLPLWTTAGDNALPVYRPDNPRVIEDKSASRGSDGLYPNKVIKYELPRGASVRLDCPPVCQPNLADPRIPLWITEGQKKADALASLGSPASLGTPASLGSPASLGLTAIALLGVWNFKGKNELGGVTFLADWDMIALKNRPVRIVFDSDVMTKRPVQQALARLTEHLQRKGARVESVYLPPGPNGEKLGVDDWLAQGHTLQELEALVQAPRPAPVLTPALVKLLDHPPLTMSRPLSLLEGRAYAAAWIYAEVTQKDGLDKRGELVRYDPPRTTTARQLFILRNDGQVFGDYGDHPLSELNLQVSLSEIPPDEQIWSSLGFQAYVAGERPQPRDVFERIVAVVDYFIDFDHSLAGQRVMAELVACYILSTWFLDAVNVIGFLWPNGAKGCGKTHLLLIVSQLAYLGELLLAGSSFATVRDMADYGATLAFDDAENLADPKKTDPNLRTLMLAGNRRGAQVAFKELGDDKKWRTRRVNAYCPRLFSAIQLPDPVLESRAIIIPLIPTADHRRGTAEPLDFFDWPHDRRKLVDDLWALALRHLPEFPEIDRWVSKNAPLTGRNLEPWRSILTVANWLETYSVRGIWTRLTQLSLDYQTARFDLDIPDLTVLVIRALFKCVKCEPGDLIHHRDNPRRTERHTLFTADITQAVIEIARAEEANLDVEAISSRRVGVQLHKMRFGKDRQPGKGTRQWIVTLEELKRLAIAYNLV